MSFWSYIAPACSWAYWNFYIVQWELGIDWVEAEDGYGIKEGFVVDTVDSALEKVEGAVSSEVQYSVDVNLRRVLTGALGELESKLN